MNQRPDNRILSILKPFEIDAAITEDKLIDNLFKSIEQGMIHPYQRELVEYILIGSDKNESKA